MAAYKSFIKASDTSFLEIADISRGHSASLEREGQNRTAFLAFFRDRQFEFFADQEEIYRLGKHIINKAVADPSWTENLQKRSAAFVAHGEHMGTFLATTDFSLFDNQFLAATLHTVHETMRMAVLEFHDEIYPHFSLALEDKLNATLCRHHLDPTKTLPSILRAKRPSPIEQYEKALASLALTLLQKKEVFADVHSKFKNSSNFAKTLHNIHKEYSWITAAWSGDGKSEEEMFKELREYTDLATSKLKRVIREKEKRFDEGRQEADRTLQKLRKMFNAKDERLLEFAVISTETGRVRMDTFYKMFFHAFNLYREIAARLDVDMADLRYLFKEEIITVLIEKKEVPIKEAKKRQQHSLLYFENGRCQLFVGKETEKWEKKVVSSATKEGGTLKGQIAYQGGTVEGTARIIMNPEDMKNMKKGEILVSSRTYPDLLPAMKKASAIVTELGGLLSHAAIVARELGIPCVVGITNITKNIKDGEVITVDTKTGIIIRKT